MNPHIYKKITKEVPNSTTHATAEEATKMKQTVSRFFELFKQKHL